MRNVLIVALICCAASFLNAQESDSTKTEPKPIPQDTIPPQKEEVREQQEERDTPRIIYYQSTDNNEPRRKTKRREIKTLSGSMSHSGGFGALSFRSSDFNDESLVMAGLRGGWIINRTLGIGVEGHGIIPTTQFENIEVGEEVSLLGGYGGMFLELIFFSNEVVHVTFPTSGGAGWLGYHRSNDNTLVSVEREIDSDVFWYVEPGANLEFNISRNFRLATGVSKRFTQDFELQNTAPGAFEKINYCITLKVGGF